MHRAKATPPCPGASRNAAVELWMAAGGRLQGPRPMMDVEPLRAKGIVDRVQTIALGQKVLEGAGSGRLHRSDRPVGGRELADARHPRLAPAPERDLPVHLFDGHRGGEV